MPIIEKTIDQLEPNNYNSDNINSQSSWFSYIRRYSRDHRGTIVPPTKTQFVRAWNLMNDQFIFSCQGNNIEECELSLKNNIFPLSAHPRLITESSWVRIILAFNMYASVCEHFGLRHNRIDFIGSMGTRSTSRIAIRNKWEYRFNGRCVLYIDNERLTTLIHLIDNEMCVDFWPHIFDIYSNLHPLIGSNSITRNITRSPRRYNPPSTSNNTVSIRLVDSPTHAIAQEYLNRTDENELDIIPNNQQIANMVLQTRNILPYDLRKIIYETCTALHISHVI